MNKNIKLAIYFLLGIVLFYLMFNGNGVEGFGQGVNFIYVRVNTGDFERFVILDATDDADDIPTRTGTGATGLQGELNNILTGGTYTYYKSESGDFFIQKLVAASCTGGSNCSGIDQLNEENCSRVTCTFTAESGNNASSCTGGPNCSGNGSVICPSTVAGCTFNAESTEYYLVRMNGETVTSIHKIRSDLNNLNVNSEEEPITGTDQPNPLQIYTVTDASGSYTSASGTSVTIDTFPRCSTPESTTGYTPVETSLKLGDNFNVSGTCASGYTGTLAATVCASDNTPYRLRGCTIETHDITCNNGSAASGSSTTPTESCTACDDGYSLDSNRCVPNGSCSDFTATCPEGKEVNEDKSCSGTCTADVCCEEESNLVMICLVVCLLIFCVILIGAGAYLTIGKKSSGPPIQSGTPGY
jgi:hypothetical protein